MTVNTEKTQRQMVCNTKYNILLNVDMLIMLSFGIKFLELFNKMDPSVERLKLERPS